VGALAALLPLAAATPAHAAAADTIDQSLVMSSWLSSQSSVPYFAQTFTAGVTGQVDRVSLPINTNFSFARFSVSIRTVNPSNHQPTATVLGSAPLFSGTIYCCQFTDFWFTPNVQVTSGTQYAIVVAEGLGNLRWLDSGSAVLYTRGKEWIGSSATSWFPSTHAGFGFKEWVASNVNSAPVVAVDKTAFGVPEGTAPSNSGTCSDADGDTVTLTASDGTVSPCSAGTWTWSKAAGDEAGTETVTITADDGNGLTAQVPFTFDVTPVDPTATIVSDPPTITVPEGTNVPITGTATSPDAADNAAGFTYAWSVTINGAPYASGSGASFSFVPGDDGSYLVSLNATDDGGMSGTTSMTVIATNVAPTAAITSVTATAPLVTTAFETLNFSGHFTDVDTADNYTITWSFGDGSSASGLNVSHSYSLPGTYTVKFQVSDGEGGVGQATTTVTVQTTQQALGSIEAYVQSLPGLNAGQKNSLIAKLQNAAAAAARGDNNAASNELNAFLNELQADVNAGKVSATAAGPLRTAVHTVQGSLGTFNRLVEWWPLEA
jgi:PKD domain-containing protein/Big-like domain-containing protein/FIMAH domain-containing protein